MILSLALVVSFIPAISQPAHADEVASQNDETSIVVAPEEADDAAVEGMAVQEAPSISAQSADEVEKKQVGFVYFGQASPIAGAVQQIAVAVDDDALTLSSAKLTYEDPQGNRHQVTAEKLASSAALFSLQTEGAGIHRLIKMEASAKASSGEVKAIEVDLAKEGEDCSFETLPDTGTALSAQSEGSDEDCLSTYALNAQGDLQEADSLDDAVALAGSMAISPQASRAGKFVVALDPGHGGTDPGAVSGGLNEADINWKIAQACKAELEKYGNVEVYVTRGQNETLSSLSARVDRAVQHGAQVFVSIHINSATASAKGAEVWYPNTSSYKKEETHEVAKDLSQKILDELGALGLSKRGIKMKDSANNSKYPDGSVRDYYGVIASAREQGIPGIIVEHAFITNDEENKKLANDAFLVQLGQADARGIAKAFGLSKTAGSWEQQANGTWKYKQADGSYASNTWLTISNKRYWIDANGIMATGAATINGVTYSFDASGVLLTKTGWQQIDGTWYYFTSSGAAKTGWLKSGSKWYYLSPADGKMALGWTTVDGKKYYFTSPNGVMRTSGWFKDGNDWYWITSSGAAKTGWQKVKNKWYYLDPSTAIMKTGWTTVDNKKYFLNTSGAMRTSGWFKQNNDWYWITSSGAAKTGWQKVKNKWYYLDPSTAIMKTGWANDGKDWYYLNANGDMRTGWFKQGSTWYYLKSSGAMATGWTTVGAKKYYLDANGKMLTGQQMIDGQRCFFESSGAFVGNGTPIMGVSQVNAAKMTTALTTQLVSMGKSYPAALAAGGAPDPAAFCRIIEEEAKAEGVRAEVVWAQVMWETGWLQMGNDVSISQFNFAGLGATGNGVAGASFPDVRTGIRAQIQHLKCYASTDALNNAKVDPRWSNSLRGKAKLVEWLGIPENPYGTGWAASKEYGYNLRKLMENKLGV